MKQLIRIRVVQFFLYEKHEIVVGRNSGVFGPNGSGKSSLLDAVQIVMLGASAKRGSGVVFNAQADESNLNTRSIRSYCLGQYGDGEGARVRPQATSYITLVWMDTETRELISTGVCIAASGQTEDHEVMGRYILRSELSLNDHLEVVDGKERPREWAAFRQQLLQRAHGEEVLFHDADRFIRALLLMLRGSRGVPNLDAFRQAFRFGLRMRFDRSVDDIVRQQVLEPRPTNISHFKEVFATFKQMSELVAGVRKKLDDAVLIAKDFEDAMRRYRHGVTWRALGRAAELEVANRAVEMAEAAEGHANQVLQDANTAAQLADAAHAAAVEHAAKAASRRDTHASHAEKGLLNEQLVGAKARHEDQRSQLRRTMSAMAGVMEACVAQGFLASSAEGARLAADAVRRLFDTGQPKSVADDRGRVEAAVRQALRAIRAVINELFTVRSGIARELKEAQDELRELQGNKERVGQGKPPLEGPVAALKRELGDAGIGAIPVCDLVKVEDAKWQPVIEAYLGATNLQALLVEEKDERAAFRIYRQARIYGAKVVMPSRFGNRRSPPHGSVAELIGGTSSAATNFLRAKFGDTMQAETEDECFSQRHALTSDGMLVSDGEMSRLRPVDSIGFKIGPVVANVRASLDVKIRVADTRVKALKKKDEAAKSLFDTVSPFGGDEEDKTGSVLQAFDRGAEAGAEVIALEARLQALDTDDYRLLTEAARQAAQEANEARHRLTAAAQARGVALNAFEEAQRRTVDRHNASAEAGKLSEEARAAEGFDGDYYSEQWDKLLLTHAVDFPAMVTECARRGRSAASDHSTKKLGAMQRLTAYLVTYQDEFIAEGQRDDWRLCAAWVSERIAFLTGTKLQEYEGKMADALETARSTFRNDVAVALNEHIVWLGDTFDRMNEALRAAPAFTNGERYRFRRTPRPAYGVLLKFVKDVAQFGPTEDLLGGAGQMPTEFEDLLREKAVPGSGAVKSPLDDYREFFDFDLEVIREDAATGTTKVVGLLSKRVGSGSGGEHRAPLYVVAGAAIASAYRLQRGDDAGLRLLVVDEAFAKMDPRNITATMRYFEELGLQVFMASTGDALGTLTAFLDRYYDIMRDAERNVVILEGHAIDAATREMFRADLPEFHPELIEQEVGVMYSAPNEPVADAIVAG